MSEVNHEALAQLIGTWKTIKVQALIADDVTKKSITISAPFQAL